MHCQIVVAYLLPAIRAMITIRGFQTMAVYRAAEHSLKIVLIHDGAVVMDVYDLCLLLAMGAFKGCVRHSEVKLENKSVTRFQTRLCHNEGSNP